MNFYFWYGNEYLPKYREILFRNILHSRIVTQSEINVMFYIIMKYEYKMVSSILYLLANNTFITIHNVLGIRVFTSHIKFIFNYIKKIPSMN